MTKRTIVIRRSNGGWQQKTKRNTNLPKQTSLKLSGNAGFVRPVLVVIISAVCVGLLYICTINHSATQGFAVKEVEKQISQLKKENEVLRIKEAELKSLYKVEDSARQLEMKDIENPVYVEEYDAVAFRSRN